MKYIDCNVQMPPAEVFIMAKLRPDNRKCICKWIPSGNTWGAHISVSSWRNLSILEKAKVKAGMLKPYTTLEG